MVVADDYTGSVNKKPRCAAILVSYTFFLFQTGSVWLQKGRWRGVADIDSALIRGNNYSACDRRGYGLTALGLRDLSKESLRQNEGRAR